MEKANKVEAGFTLDYVSTWLESQPNKQTRNYKNYNSYTAPFPKYEFQIDLMVMSSLLNDVGVDAENQPKFGFVCVDIFSKKCHIVPMEIMILVLFQCYVRMFSSSRLST